MAETATPVASAPKGNTNSGLQENVAGMLAYVLGIFSGLFFILTEKENRFVRFHAFQSIMATVAAFIVSIAAGVIPTALGDLIQLIVNIGIFLVWLYLMYQAYQGKMYKLPYIGDMAEQQNK